MIWETEKDIGAKGDGKKDGNDSLIEDKEEI